MLQFDPSRRITVDEALAHPYLALLHDAGDEPTAGAPFAFEVPPVSLDCRAQRGRGWGRMLGHGDDVGAHRRALIATSRAHTRTTANKPRTIHENAIRT